LPPAVAVAVAVVAAVVVAAVPVVVPEAVRRVVVRPQGLRQVPLPAVVAVWAPQAASEPQAQLVRPRAAVRPRLRQPHRLAAWV
jgi:hypothetical protein